MKNFFYPTLAASLLALILSSCGASETGELVGALDRPDWKGIQPYGMVYVPPGTAHVGNSDQDITGTYIQRPKSISINGFFMDDTEITNNEYRQFIHWVRDSVAIDMMGWFNEDGNLDWEAREDLDFTADEL
ncbi:MAG: SUMF1/EgtB/PvdO family nonheme iron enzyme, partial [Bacteroidota bacterium]